MAVTLSIVLILGEMANPLASLTMTVSLVIDKCIVVGKLLAVHVELVHVAGACGTLEVKGQAVKRLLILTSCLALLWCDVGQRFLVAAQILPHLGCIPLTLLWIAIYWLMPITKYNGASDLELLG